MAGNFFKIATPFNEQYTLLIESDMMAVHAKMQSKTQIRWDFTVLDVTGEYAEIRLILLDHLLLEANNPLIKEIAAVTKVFSRLYNELHLIIDHAGSIKRVLNMEVILSKWQQTKAEMEKLVKHTPDVQNVINLNDSIFQNPDRLKEGIQKSEFFMVYFSYLFGKAIPYESNNVISPNAFNTVNVKWGMGISTLQALPAEKVQLSMRMRPFLQSDFNERAYSQFADKIDIKKLIPELKEEAIYNVNYTQGRVLDAVLQKQEVAHENQLYNKLTYRLTSDTAIKEKRLKESSSASKKNSIIVEIAEVNVLK